MKHSCDRAERNKELVAMAQSEPNELFAMVELNYRGVFNRNPFSYTGGVKTIFNDVDFSSMTYSEFVTFCERFMHEECKKFYYCEPDMSFMEGLNPILDDVEYSAFIFDAYGTDGVISVYVDHIGVGVDGWNDDEDNDDDEHESCIDGENEDNIDELRNVAFEFNEDVVHMNRTSNDPFLSKLCVDDEDANNIVDDDNGREVEVNIQAHSIFNELLQWKKQKPILGMRFKGPGQVKSMLCNYAVANGYQLCFEKNDRTRLLVRCSKGACTFRLWASWMSDEESFQIKSLKADRNCARNFKFGSLVTYAWIGSHYTKEIVESQKISVRKLRLKVMAKFGIQVSMGQCRRAKKYALKLVEGNLVEHYGKLWLYGHEILRTNPGSTVKLDMEDGPDGKKHFSKFYCCFQGVKQGWIEGCRRVIGLDGCFLKGVCKGELLCAIGRDANDKIYPIAWAMVNVENKQNWKWFLELLIDDLHLNLRNGFSLMSDQHKKRFTGAIYHTLFWRASKATTEHAFKVVMKEIETLNPEAHQYLMEKDPKTWSRAFFQTGRCCDAVENGFSESFNAVIVDSRKKPTITMLEEIRLYMMDKIYNMKLKGQQWGNHIFPEIRDKVNFLKKAQRHYQGSTSEPQQHEEVEMTPIEMDTTHNDMQVAPTDVESSSARDFIQYVQFTPPRSYEGDEGVMGEEADVVEEDVVVEQLVQGEEAEEVDPVIQVDNVNVQEVDEVNPNTQVDNGNVQEVAPVNQVQQVCVRLISDILKRIRRRKSERILKLKLGKTIGGVDDLGNSKGKSLVID
ncbi:unnamed protein product [Lactuca saligna]|uniref:Transposase MuDR plant domain-containing protein n=1 Tax=Lactuca saligna TaxID=75948 RepID=A0AA36EL78_LACSI|nr:unnamed protein product [Lactuca saligna]